MNSSFSIRRSLRLAQKNGEQILALLDGYNPEAFIFPRLTPALIGLAVGAEAIRAVYAKDQIYALLIENGTVDTEQEAREWLRRQILDLDLELELGLGNGNAPVFL